MSEIAEVKVTFEAKGNDQKRILEYLNENASDELIDKINNGKKTLDSCYDYLQKQARELKESGSQCVMVEDDVVYGWMIKYFEDDSIEPPKPKPKPAKKTAKKKASKKKAAAKKESSEDNSKVLELFDDKKEKSKGPF